MSEKPTINVIPKENVPGAPSWVNNLLYPINLFIQGVNQGWTSFNYSQNFDAEEKSVQIYGSSTPTNNTFNFVLKKAQKPKEVRIRQIYQSDNLGDIFNTPLTYTYNNGVLTVTSIPDLSDGVLYTISVLVYYQ